MATTLSDIAKEIRLSTSTVADVLRGRPGYSTKTQTRVHDAARRLDYVPNHMARSLLRQASRTIGIAGPLNNTAVTGSMLHAITTDLSAAGYMPLFADTLVAKSNEGIERAVRELRSRSVDGLILAGGWPGSMTKDSAKLIPQGLPYVTIDSADQSRRQSVIADHKQPMRHAVQWLAVRGHRRIAFMGINNAQSASNPFNTHCLKITGYEQAMKDLGLYDPALLLDADWPAGDVCKAVVSQPDRFKSITAVIGSNDRVAMEVMNGLSELGLSVPGDCSVIGFDNTDFAAGARPALTTFEPRRPEVGAAAVKMLLDLINGKSVKSCTIVPRLVERASAGPCRKNGTIA